MRRRRREKVRTVVMLCMYERMWIMKGEERGGRRRRSGERGKK